MKNQVDQARLLAVLVVTAIGLYLCWLMLHELFVFFSVLGGISVFELLGIVLGPVVLAITLALLQTFRPPITEPVVAD